MFSKKKQESKKEKGKSSEQTFKCNVYTAVTVHRETHINMRIMSVYSIFG